MYYKKIILFQVGASIYIYAHEFIMRSLVTDYVACVQILTLSCHRLLNCSEVKIDATWVGTDVSTLVIVHYLISLFIINN
jgi:NADH:ubiquinone oxidoreductase subunit 6 (subunit J)